MGTDAPFQLGSISLDRAKDDGVVHLNITGGVHAFEITIGVRATQMLADRPQNDLLHKLPILERVLVIMLHHQLFSDLLVDDHGSKLQSGNRIFHHRCEPQLGSEAVLMRTCLMPRAYAGWQAWLICTGCGWS